MATTTEPERDGTAFRPPGRTGHETWSPLAVLRPPLPDQGDSVVLSTAWHNKRAAVKRQALLDLLTAQFLKEEMPAALTDELETLGFIGELATHVDPDSASHMAHWWQRGWHPSLEYYLWSRQNAFFDEYDPLGERRREAIAQYLAQGGPPARLQPAGPRRALAQPKPLPPDVTLGQLLLQRRTIRRYVPEPVAESVFSAVLWFGLDQARRARSRGVDDPIDYLRSIGAAFDPYIVVYSVEQFDPGVYYYDLLQHAVVQLRQGLYRTQMVHNILEHPAPESASWTVVLVADFAQYQWRYRHERALRHLYIEAGRLGQYLLLAGMAFGLGTLTTPATRDRDLSGLLQVDGARHVPIYTLTMGHDRRFHRGGTP